ncbi:MAG: hypothetical protein R3332_05110 [Pseudohongiellaceae bacterium]|nr:hypothetical protein [Pseudohongiellaceae bacterium]
MKLPRLKIRKSTRATISGILIAIASLYALASAYDEARNNLLRFFILSVSMLLILALFAAGVVLIKVLLKSLFALGKKKLTPSSEDEE